MTTQGLQLLQPLYYYWIRSFRHRTPLLRHFTGYESLGTHSVQRASSGLRTSGLGKQSFRNIRFCHCCQWLAARRAYFCYKRYYRQPKKKHVLCKTDSHLFVFPALVQNRYIDWAYGLSLSSDIYLQQNNILYHSDSQRRLKPQRACLIYMQGRWHLV